MSQLVEQIEDLINRNTIPVVIRGIKHRTQKKYDIENVLANTVCCYFGWNKNQFIYTWHQ